MIQLLINEACNNSCLFCAAACSASQYVPKDTIIDFIDDCFTFPDALYDRRVVFTGGEPGLHPDLVPLVDYTKSKYAPVEIGLITNGRPFSHKQLAQEVHTAGVEWALVSMYGASPAKHDYITQRPGGFDQTLRGIENLLNAGVHVEVRTILHRDMLSQLKKFADIVMSRFPECWRMSAVTMDYVGTAPQHIGELSVCLQDVGVAFRDAADYCASKGWPLRLVCFPLCLLPAAYWELVIPAEAIPQHFLSWEKATHNNSKENFAHPKGCEKCLIQGICPGIASSYLQYFPSSVVAPVTDIGLELDRNSIMEIRGEHALIGNRRTGNWMFIPSEQEGNKVNNNGQGVSFRHKRELLRQELAQVKEAGTFQPLFLTHEQKRDKQKSIFDWNFFVYNVTNHCNFSCAYCYTDKNKNHEAPIDAILTRIASVASQDFCIEIHGNGEPLVRFKELRDALPNFRRLLENSRSNCQMLLVTNGSLISDEVANFLAGERFAVIVSLDGPEEIHDRVRKTPRGSGTYKMVMAGIERLMKAGVPISINSVVSCQDADSIIKTFEHHLSHGLYRMKFIPVVPTDSYIETLPISSYAEAMREIYHRVNAWNCNRSNPRLEILNLSYAVLALLGIPNRYQCMDLPCAAGTKSLTINANGDIYPCHKLASLPEWCCGNILDLRERSVLEEHPIIQRTIACRNEFSGDCKQCPCSGFCGGLCLADKVLCSNLSKNFDCMRDVFWDLIKKTDDDIASLEPLMLEPRLGDLI
jgi:uncharacterized protein